MTVSEHICPVCKTANQVEASVCKHCGAALDGSLIDLGGKTTATDIQSVTPEMIREWFLQEEKEAVVPDNGIAFYVDGHSMPAYMDPRGEFILGRNAGTSAEQLLDLAPFGGYSLGLSKRHASIRRAGDGYELLDQESVNGTWLNEEKLVPKVPYPLPSGSHLRLGRMRILVLYRLSAETNRHR